METFELVLTYVLAALMIIGIIALVISIISVASLIKVDWKNRFYKQGKN